MVAKDFFTFNEEEYRQRISAYTTERLVKQEVVKIRTHYAGVGQLELALVVPSSQWQKKQLIQEELNGRIVKLHEMQKRDFLIPLAAGPTGLGVGVGMEHVFMGATNVVTDGLCSPSGSSAIQQVAAHPAEALHSALAGATEQTLEMTFGIENLGLGVIPGSDLSSELLAANTTWITLPNGAEAAGFQQACCYLKDQKKPRPSLLSLGVHRKRWRYSTAEARQPTLCYAAGSSV